VKKNVKTYNSDEKHKKSIFHFVYILLLKN